MLQGPKGTLQGPFSTLQGLSGMLWRPSGTLPGPSGTLLRPLGTLQGPLGTQKVPLGTLQGPSEIQFKAIQVHFKSKKASPCMHAMVKILWECISQKIIVRRNVGGTNC